MKNYNIFLLLILCFITATIVVENVIAYNVAEESVTEENISELILTNGLKIIVKPEHRSPSVVFQIWYKTGS